MKKIQGILFDCDGVLLDSEEKFRQVQYDALKEGIDNFKLDFKDFLHASRGLQDSRLAEIMLERGIKIPDNFFDKSNDFLINNYANMADKIENVEEMLQDLADYPKAICSNNWTYVYQKALDKHDLDKYFQIKLGSDVVEKSKPDPCVYLEGAKRLGLSIENCLAIEDTPGIGLTAAKASNAGVVVGFTGSGSTVEDLKAGGADYTIDSLLELPVLIKKLNEEG